MNMGKSPSGSPFSLLVLYPMVDPLPIYFNQRRKVVLRAKQRSMSPNLFYEIDKHSPMVYDCSLDHNL